MGWLIPVLYVPVAILAIVSRRAYLQYLDAYERKMGRAAMMRLYPERDEDWNQRYAAQPWQWIRDTPRLLLASANVSFRRQTDPDLEQQRLVSYRWGIATIASMLTAMIVTIALTLR